MHSHIPLSFIVHKNVHFQCIWWVKKCIHYVYEEYDTARPCSGHMAVVTTEPCSRYMWVEQICSIMHPVILALLWYCILNENIRTTENYYMPSTVVTHDWAIKTCDYWTLKFYYAIVCLKCLACLNLNLHVYPDIVNSDYYAESKCGIRILPQALAGRGRRFSGLGMNPRPFDLRSSTLPAGSQISTKVVKNEKNWKIHVLFSYH